MITTRRKLLQAASVAPIALSGTVVPAAVAALPVAEPTAHEFVWRYSHDGGERYGEMFDTKEQALKYLKEYGFGRGCISECKQQDYSLEVDGDQIWELLYGQNEDRMDEDGEFIDYTESQMRDLGDMVTATIKQWAAKHKIATTAWKFDEVRNTVQLCHRCEVEVADPVLLDNDSRYRLCGACWTRDRHAEPTSDATPHD